MSNKMASEDLGKEAVAKRYWSLRDLVKKKKIEVGAAMKNHQEMSKKVAELLLLRQRVSLLQESLESQKQILDKASRDLACTRQSNNRKEEKLKRVKSKDFDKKYTQANKECDNLKVTLNKEKTELFEMRRSFITQLMSRVFPLSVPATHEDTPVPETNEDSTTDSLEYDMIADHLPKTHHRSSYTRKTGLHHIGYGSLPANGVMREYVSEVKLKNMSSEVAVATDEQSEEEPDPLNDLVLSVSAALCFVTHSVSIIATTLDQSLPYPLLLPVILCEYGQPDRKAQNIIRFLAKLDDNITFLSFTQAVPVELLKVGHTLKNLSVLVEHPQLGRNGPFTCHPELLHCPTVSKRHRMTREQNYTAPDWETEPPILHSAHQEDQNQPQDLLNSSIAAQEGDDGEECSGQSDESDEDNLILQGWEEVQDLMVPTRFFPGFHGERLEYGLSTSEISHRSVLNQVGAGMDQEEASSSVQYSSGLLNTLSSLLGSAWTKQ